MRVKLTVKGAKYFAKNKSVMNFLDAVYNGSLHGHIVDVMMKSGEMGKYIRAGIVDIINLSDEYGDGVKLDIRLTVKGAKYFTKNKSCMDFLNDIFNGTLQSSMVDLIVKSGEMKKFMKSGLVDLLPGIMCGLDMIDDDDEDDEDYNGMFAFEKERIVRETQKIQMYKIGAIDEL